MLFMIALSLQLLYQGCALLLALYTIGQGVVLVAYWRQRRASLPPSSAPDVWPAVTVQLPLYNEPQVVRRLLRAVAALEYPSDQLHIQILDDSTDATSQIIAAFIRRNPHLSIQHIRRTRRTGYKAGALAHGLAQTTAPFVAIFDADFVPPSDFLRRTLPYLLADARLGVVQTRWGHLNARDNWLTRAQRLTVDAHFVVEQVGRNRAGWLIPFNGTGGVWRVAAIHAAGGWSAATLTEDLDLSYRAQMRGWRSLMLPDVVVPGELPPHLGAYRQQQARWAQGNTHCLRRLCLPLWRSDVSLGAKLMGTQHLCQYLPQGGMLALLLLAPPLILLDAADSMALAPLGFVSLIPPLMYAAGQGAHDRRGLANLWALPALMLLGTGLIAHNSLAVWRGLRGAGGAFKRTPKLASHPGDSRTLLPAHDLILEAVLLLYALWGVWLAAQHRPALVPYLLLYALGFACVIGAAVLQDRPRKPTAPAVQRDMHR